MKQFEKRLDKLEKDLRAAGVSFLCFFAKETEVDSNQLDTHSMAGGDIANIVTAMAGCHNEEYSEELALTLEFAAKEIRKRNRK